jgi:hypothetical protein
LVLPPCFVPSAAGASFGNVPTNPDSWKLEDEVHYALSTELLVTTIFKVESWLSSNSNKSPCQVGINISTRAGTAFQRHEMVQHVSTFQPKALNLDASVVVLWK